MKFNVTFILSAAYLKTVLDLHECLLCTGCSGKLDLVLLVDSSGSIRHERWHHVLDYLVQVVGNLTIGERSARVACVRWSDRSTVDFYFDSYTTKQDIIMAIKRMGFEVSVSIYSHIRSKSIFQTPQRG